MASKAILEEKQKKIDEIGEIFKSNGAYLFDYRGLTVNQMEELRNKVKEHGANVKVIKNRMAIKYFEQAGKETFGRNLFKGPLAVAYAKDSFIEVAKIITEFEKENEKVEIKAGFIEQVYAEKAKLVALAKLPGRDQLMAQLALSISMPVKKMGMALSAPIRNMLILMNNLKDKKEKEEK